MKDPYQASEVRGHVFVCFRFRIFLLNFENILTIFSVSFYLIRYDSENMTLRLTLFCLGINEYADKTLRHIFHFSYLFWLVPNPICQDNDFPICFVSYLFYFIFQTHFIFQLAIVSYLKKNNCEEKFATENNKNVDTVYY